MFSRDISQTVSRTKRTLSEAFPRDAASAAAIERPRERSFIADAMDALCWIFAIALLAAIVTAPAWWPK